MTLTWLKPPHRALVVGINAYDAPSTLISDLNGAVADAQAVYDFLTQELGMAESDILLLTSPATDDAHKATRANLWQGLSDFLGNVPAHSEVLFYYSGHGSEAKISAEIAFGDTKGEALVPQDARTGTILDILDRELWAIRAKWHQQQIRVTSILDSCFAGDVFRGKPNAASPEPAARLTGPAHTLRTLATIATVDGQPQSKATLTQLHEENTRGYPFQTFIAGCSSNQLSWEVLSQGQKRGVMTTALLEALRSTAAPITYAELAQLIPALVTPARLEKQEPNITGHLYRGVFGTAVPERQQPAFAIQAVGEESIEIRAGLIAGLEVDSELESYSDWSLTTSTGTWQVTDAKAKWASATRLTGNEPSKSGQPIVLRSRSNRLTVYFDPSAKKIQEFWGKKDSQDTPTLIEVNEMTTADYVVTADQTDYIARRKDGVIHPSLRKGQQTIGSIYDLARQLNRVAAYETFVARKPTEAERWQELKLNQGDGIDLTVEQVDWNGKATPLVVNGLGTLLPQARLQITVKNNTKREVWVAVYLLDEPVFVAERLSPNDSNFHLLPDQERTIKWDRNQSQGRFMWEGGLVPLKVFVSSQLMTEVDAAKFPAGLRDPNRGDKMARGLRIVKYKEGSGLGWATFTLTYGL